MTVKGLRKQKGIGPPEMAKKLQIKLSTYHDKEAGRRKFKPAEIVKICVMFKCRVEEIEDFYH